MDSKIKGIPLTILFARHKCGTLYIQPGRGTGKEHRDRCLLLGQDGRKGRFVPGRKRACKG